MNSVLTVVTSIYRILEYRQIFPRESAAGAVPQARPPTQIGDRGPRP
jgi:hypothetical protein